MVKAMSWRTPFDSMTILLGLPPLRTKPIGTMLWSALPCAPRLGAMWASRLDVCFS
jgi:hypothetical protein